MHFTGEMNRTSAMHGIPTRGIGTAKKLCFQAYTYGPFLSVHSHHCFRRIPGGSAGSAPKNPKGVDASF